MKQYKFPVQVTLKYPANSCVVGTNVWMGESKTNRKAVPVIRIFLWRGCGQSRAADECLYDVPGYALLLKCYFVGIMSKTFTLGMIQMLHAKTHNLSRSLVVPHSYNATKLRHKESLQYSLENFECFPNVLSKLLLCMQ